MYIETWLKIRCPKCSAVNWVCNGDVSDLTGCDVVGVSCHACQHRFLLIDDNDEDMDDDEDDYEEGLPSPQ